jgi:biotin transport system substrate-specific component
MWRPETLEERAVTVRPRTPTANFAPTLAADRTRSAALIALGAVSFAVLTWVGANVYIPLTPVPVTLQTLFVLLAGSVAGRRAGAASQLMYVGAGALGLPVFAGGLGGWGVIAGPTGGYLLSFLVAPWIVSGLVSRHGSLGGQIAAFAAGTGVIFVFGITHLALFYTGDLSAAISVGLVPFIPGAVVKVVAAVSIHRSATALRDRVGRRHRS